MTDAAAAQVDILNRLYPEIGAGGFSHVDGTVQFYTRVNALLDPSMRVVDYGAGRGEWMTDPVRYRRGLRDLRGKVLEVIGVDIDPAVQTNNGIDRYVVCQDPTTIPLPDESVDMVLADHTFEHLELPAAASQEMARILKPGGWICARTPNRWGYIAIAASIIPNVRHVRALERLQPGREDVDIFPTRYRLNTFKAITRYFPKTTFVNCSYYWAGDPGYFARSERLARFIRLGSKPLPAPLKPKIFIFLQKSATKAE